MIKGAIFDMDGLMFDTERLFTESWFEAGKASGLYVPEEFTHEVSGSSGPMMMDIIRKHIPDVPDPWEFWQLCYRICVNKQYEKLPEKPGLHTILKTLSDLGIRMIVASSSPRSLVEHNLEASGVKEYYAAVVSGTEVEHGKPAPDIFIKAVSILGLSPSDCCVFEDSFNGIRAAHAAGCIPIMIPDLTQPTDEIRNMCKFICSDLNEAAQIIRKNNLGKLL